MPRDKSNCRHTDFYALLLGGHRDDMVPLPRYFAASAIPIIELLSKEKIDRIMERTRKADGEIVGLLKTGSAFYSPSLGAITMAEAILKDKKRVILCCVYLEGEYGLTDICFGVPVKLGAKGIEEIITLKLNAEEKEAVKKSAKGVTKSIDELGL